MSQKGTGAFWDITRLAGDVPQQNNHTDGERRHDDEPDDCLGNRHARAHYRILRLPLGHAVHTGLHTRASVLPQRCMQRLTLASRSSCCLWSSSEPPPEHILAGGVAQSHRFALHRAFSFVRFALMRAYRHGTVRVQGARQVGWSQGFYHGAAASSKSPLTMPGKIPWGYFTCAVIR